METAIARYQPLAGREAFQLEGLAEDDTVFQPIQDSGAWEPHVIAVLERVVKPWFVCLDVGANIGAITLPLARLAWKGRVYAFEASATAYELLKRNVAGNSLENVTTELAAISDITGNLVDIYTQDAQIGCAHMTNGPKGGNRKESVATLALDDYPFMDIELWGIDFIKMDIEGAEIAGLRGARTWLKIYKPILVIEYNPVSAHLFAGQDRRDLYDVLTALYPRISIIGAGGALEPVPDWECLDQALNMHTWRDLLCTH